MRAGSGGWRPYLIVRIITPVSVNSQAGDFLGGVSIDKDTPSTIGYFANVTCSTSDLVSICSPTAFQDPLEVLRHGLN